MYRVADRITDRNEEARSNPEKGIGFVFEFTIYCGSGCIRGEGVDRGGGGTGIEGAESGVEGAESGVEGAGSGSRGGGKRGNCGRGSGKIGGRNCFFILENS